MRTIKVYNTEKNPPLQDLELEGNTVKELCDALGINPKNKRITGRTTRADYSDIDGLISSQDEYIFIGPKKMSSGYSEAEDDQDLQQLKDELKDAVDNLVDYLFNTSVQAKSDNTSAQVSSEDCPECNQLEQEARSLGLRG